MAEYIEREALIKRFNSNDVVHKMDNENFHYKQGYLTGLITASVVAKAMPSADVVEVVRCEKCKHAKLDLMEKGLIVCRRPVLKNGQLLPFNWETKYNNFCSYGVLKEREGK